jgi:hypothetical protein
MPADSLQTGKWRELAKAILLDGEHDGRFVTVEPPREG